MGNKRRRPRREAWQNNGFVPSQKVFASPFQSLKSLVKLPAPAPGKTSEPKTAAPQASNASAPEGQPEELFERAMTGVRPLARPDRYRQPCKPPAPRRTVTDEDAQALAELCSLVSGSAPFDITQTEEYVEGRRVGLDPRLMARLKRGEFAIQAHTDLHGMTRAVAKQALSEFIARSVRNGHQSVLVVTGRGLRSPGGEPVIKRALTYWLSHGQLSAHVLAFATARPTDGGAGAVYVLLRRERRRARFEVLGPTRRAP
jgi:DNA-nicking Smr family endonuclease